MRYLPFLLVSATLCLAAKKPEGNSTAAATGANCNIVANRTVVAGDNLANIATSTNTTVAQLQFVNTQITNPRLINVGDVIKIPDSRCVAPATAPLAEPTATCVNGTAKTTKVVAGDTLIIIAKEKLGITLPALVAANPQIKDINKINVGDVINIPLCGAAGGATSTPGGNGTTTGEAPKATTSKAPKKEQAKIARRARLMRRTEEEEEETYV